MKAHKKKYDFKIEKIENGFVFFKIKKIQKNQNLYKFLKSQNFSENYLSKLRKDIKHILINKKNAKIIDKIHKNDIIGLQLNFQKDKNNFLPCEKPINIVYEDDFFLIVNKDAGISSIPSRKNFTDNLVSRISFYLSTPTVRLINRLDKDTAGFIIVAKNSFAASLSNRLCSNKTYFAICNGICSKKIHVSNNIKTLVDENGINIRKRVLSEDSAHIKTIAHPLKTLQGKFTLFRVKIQGGKTHQIRVHLSSAGFSLVGDEIYGKKHKIGHTALFCGKLDFYYPILKKVKHFALPYPNDFLEFFN